MLGARELGGWLLVGAGLMGMATGCELIATADRSRIPGESGGEGGSGGIGGMGGGGEGGDVGECTTPDQCPGTPTDSNLVTCDDNTCGEAFASAGTTCDENGGNVCDDAGVCVECLATTDCDTNEICDVPSNTCLPEQCFDGIENGTESAIDCGGDDCLPCDNGADLRRLRGLHEPLL